MYLKRLEISGFKSFAKKSVFEFTSSVTAIVGPNGSGKSNIAEAVRFVLGEQSMKSMRGKRGEDLIWNGSQSIGRSNHASVSIVFDNSNKVFDIDYDEVAIKREVYRDGTNRYFVNGSQVRLRDVVELLAKVHIGATGHHIISQGEADRVLSAGVKERRMIIEEALGLKIYKWKIDESEKKLQKTEENIKQVESLRRELTPHLRFLKKQVEKIEKAKEMRETLKDLYAGYLKREDVYLNTKGVELDNKISDPLRELEVLESRLTEAKRMLEETKKENPKAKALVKIEEEISAVRQKKEELSRTIGRVEGMIEFESRRVTRARGDQDTLTVPFKTVKSFTEDISKLLDGAASQEDVFSVRAAIERIKTKISDFLLSVRGGKKDEVVDVNEVARLEEERSALEKKLEEVLHLEKALAQSYENLKNEIEREKDTSREVERAIFEMMAKKSELSAAISAIKSERSALEKEKIAFKEEVREGVALIGGDITQYEHFVVDEEEVMNEDRSVQEARRREIEKIKIKLEEHGGIGGDEIMKEYEEALERDSFLERELADLEKSKESLRQIIKELSEKLDAEFKEGIRKINKQFQAFFSLMFGGGVASLAVVTQKKKRRSDIDISLASGDDEFADHEEEGQEGIEVNVSLPRKKIKGLQMLSGGERALTSIALIFAISQVNPPPFLVLDETDAALDEANSRRYGDMIENLSKHSQLIVVTHNRETMSRAGVLYGVTMGSDAVSKLLSIKFEEAQVYAK